MSTLQILYGTGDESLRYWHWKGDGSSQASCETAVGEGQLGTEQAQGSVQIQFYINCFRDNFFSCNKSFNK